MHPELTERVPVQEDDGDREDTDGQQYSYVSYVFEFLKGDQPSLDESCYNWLESTYKDSNGGLCQLKDEGILGHERCVMNTVLCCMLHSVASIQLDCDYTTVASRNIYLTAYMQVVKTIRFVCSEAKFDLSQCIRGLIYYCNNLHKQKIEIRTLDQLYKDMKNHPDSGVPVSQFLTLTSYVCMTTEWHITASSLDLQ